MVRGGLASQYASQGICIGGGICIKEKGGGLPTDDGRGSAYRGGGVMHSGGVLPTQEGVCIQRGSASRGDSTYRQKGVCLQVVCIQGVGVCLQGGLHPGTRGICIQGICLQRVGGMPNPPELEKRAVRILMECFPVETINFTV